MKYKNNPANIRYVSKNKWIGLVGQENGFCLFDTFHHGLRVLVVLLRRYIQDYDCNTVEKIISRFAPPTENNTRNYIRFVSGVLGHYGLSSCDVKFDCKYIYPLCYAICMMETSTVLNDNDKDFIYSIVIKKNIEFYY